jgi:uncharacterized protein (UPF0303 family)
VAGSSDELLAEEEELQFGSFTNDDAWALGCALVEAASGLPVAIDISRGEQRLFHAGLPGPRPTTTPGSSARTASCGGSGTPRTT